MGMLKKLKMSTTIVVMVFSVFFLTSCNGVRRGSPSSENSGDTVSMKYAKHLLIVSHKDYTEVTLANPWKPGQILHRYFLVEKGKNGDRVSRELAASGERGKNVDIIRTPVERSVVFTSPHCYLLYELGRRETIVGVCDIDYVNMPDVKRRVYDKSVGQGEKVADCGSSMQPLLETIIDSKPEILLISPYENNSGLSKLEKLKIPVVEAADYMETSPLGRAEWMKFYGLVFGSKEEASQLFERVESEYIRLEKYAAKLPAGRSILTERKMGNIWYLPGGQSTVGILLKDANARYIFSTDTHCGSLSLSPETVIDRAGEVDVWAFKYIGTILEREDLLSEYAGYSSLLAFKKGNVFECNTLEVPYFEETSFHPEYLLREMTILAHPEAKLGKLRYYRLMPASKPTKGGSRTVGL